MKRMPSETTACVQRVLYNGLRIPAIGFGPGIFQSAPAIPPVPSWNLIRRAWNKYYGRRHSRQNARRSFINAVANGISAGFRLIDFSTSYGDGNLIREAIEKSGVDRNELFLTCRVGNRAQFQGPNAIRELVHRQLKEFAVEKFDILMFHWPVTGCYEATWRELCKFYDQGISRSIGVANCHPHHLKKLMSCGLKPMLNQFEVHPLFSQKDLIKFNQDMGILVESYTPIARNDPRLFRLPRLNEIATLHGKKTVQVVLRWHLQQGLVPIIRSLNSDRQMENLGVFDFSLSEDEMKTIDSFNINSRLRYDPDNCDFTIL